MDFNGGKLSLYGAPAVTNENRSVVQLHVKAVYASRRACAQPDCR